MVWYLPKGLLLYLSDLIEKAMTNENALPSSLKRRVIEKINANKLTIIVGPTGCGEYLAADVVYLSWLTSAFVMSNK